MSGSELIFCDCNNDCITYIEPTNCAVGTFDCTGDMIIVSERKTAVPTARPAYIAEDIANKQDNLLNPNSTGYTSTLAVYNAITGVTASTLNLDQTITQAVINGYPQFYGIQFDITTPETGHTNSEGRLHWNADDGTLDIGLPGGNVVQQIGEEMLVRVVNKTGNLIPNGAVVYGSISQGNKPTVVLGDKQYQPKGVGVATEDIPNNKFGYVTSFGLVRDINTSAWSGGTILYVNTGGTMTDIRPEAPNYVTAVGLVMVQSTNVGSIFVNTVLNPKFTELSDVNGTPLTTTGQIPIWNNNNKYFDFNYNILTDIPSDTIHNSGYTTYMTVTGGTAQIYSESTGYSMTINNGTTEIFQVDADGNILCNGSPVVYQHKNGGFKGLYLGTNIAPASYSYSSIYIGNLSGRYTKTSSNYNTVLGYTAGQRAGGASTFIGGGAGMNSSGVGNIFLGYRAGINQTTVSNILFIDNQNRGSISGETTNALITGNFAAEKSGQTVTLNANTTVSFDNPNDGFIVKCVDNNVFAVNHEGTITNPNIQAIETCLEEIKTFAVAMAVAL